MFENMSKNRENLMFCCLHGWICLTQVQTQPSPLLNFLNFGAVGAIDSVDVKSVSYTHLTLPTTPYV